MHDHERSRGAQTCAHCLPLMDPAHCVRSCARDNVSDMNNLLCSRMNLEVQFAHELD